MVGAAEGGDSETMKRGGSLGFHRQFSSFHPQHAFRGPCGFRTMRTGCADIAAVQFGFDR